MSQGAATSTARVQPPPIKIRAAPPRAHRKAPLPVKFDSSKKWKLAFSDFRIRST